jgi:hypothetical protein
MRELLKQDECEKNLHIKCREQRDEDIAETKKIKNINI